MQISYPAKIEQGFTLIELMIVIAIVAILATIAIPSYQNYTKKAAVAELLQASSPYRSEVELCIYHQGGRDNCHAGSHGIQHKLENKGRVASVEVKSGVITVSGRDSLADTTYILTPDGDAAQGVSWQAACSPAEIFPAGACS